MSSIFGRLSFDNSSVTVSNVSSDTATTLSQMPPLMSTWQQQDMASSAVSGYFTNPLTTQIQEIWNTANSIIQITGLSSSNASSISDAASALQTAANNFTYHTNRLSGVNSVNQDTATLPHYKTAVSIGKMVLFITSQTDGIQNNAPIMGNFSSLFTANNLTAYYPTIQNYPTIVGNSIIETTDPILLTSSYASSLSPSQISTIASNIGAISTFMDTKRTNDVNFYTNSQNIINDYNAVSQFTDMNETEKYLCNNFVGSTKLKSRINS